MKRRGFVESLELHQIAVAQQPSGSGSGERGCVHRPFLAEKGAAKGAEIFPSRVGGAADEHHSPRGCFHQPTA